MWPTRREFMAGRDSKYPSTGLNCSVTDRTAEEAVPFTPPVISTWSTPTQRSQLEVSVCVGFTWKCDESKAKAKRSKANQRLTFPFGSRVAA